MAGRGTQRIRCPGSRGLDCSMHLVPAIVGDRDTRRIRRLRLLVFRIVVLFINIFKTASLQFCSCHAMSCMGIGVGCRVCGVGGLGGCHPRHNRPGSHVPTLGWTEMSGGRGSVNRATALDSHGCVTENNLKRCFLYGDLPFLFSLLFDPFQCAAPPV